MWKWLWRKTKLWWGGGLSRSRSLPSIPERSQPSLERARSRALIYCPVDSSCAGLEAADPRLSEMTSFRWEVRMIVKEPTACSTTAGWSLTLMILAGLQARKPCATSPEHSLEMSAEEVAFLVGPPSICSASDSCEADALSHSRHA